MNNGKFKEWLTEEGLLQVEAWARDGLTNEDIAYNMSISVKTLYEWKNKYSKFCNALKRGKEVTDIKTENALLKRALGYEYIETKETHKNIDGKEYIETTITTKQVIPDVTACIFWLKNRKPEEWKDKVNNDLNLTGGVTIIDDIPR